MPTSYAIRPVVSSDVPAVVEHVRTILAEFRFEFGIGSKTDEELLGLPQSYEAQGGAFWVVEEGVSHRLVGTAGIAAVRPDAFELRKMYLLPETRGYGLGVALLERSVQHAIERGAQRLVLDTAEQMQTAIAFYERHGFVRDDREMRAVRCTRGYVLDLSTWVEQ